MCLCHEMQQPARLRPAVYWLVACFGNITQNSTNNQLLYNSSCVERMFTCLSAEKYYMYWQRRYCLAAWCCVLDCQTGLHAYGICPNQKTSSRDRASYNIQFAVCARPWVHHHGDLQLSFPKNGVFLRPALFLSSRCFASSA